VTDFGEEITVAAMAKTRSTRGELVEKRLVREVDEKERTW
jgi:hypothetical protein